MSSPWRFDRCCQVRRARCPWGHLDPCSVEQLPYARRILAGVCGLLGKDGADRMNWHQGNATQDRDEKGWLIGFFATGEQGVNYSEEVEIKWSDHTAGDVQMEWEESQGTSVSILVSGEMHIHFPDGTAVLREQGDYVRWEPGVNHRFSTPMEARVITVRWPSRPAD